MTCRTTIAGMKWGQPDSPRRGRLWVVEGGDGSGKSTQLMLLKARLEGGRLQLSCHASADRLVPATAVDPPLPERWRNALRGANLSIGWPRADRLSHCAEVIRPALHDYDYVLCDRYVYSSLVYFAHRGIPMDFTMSINAGIPAPDGAVFLDVPPETMDVRLSGRDGDQRKFEERGVGTIGQIRDGFLSLSWMLRIVDATRPAAEVLKQVLEELRAGLPKGTHRTAG